tara:strand:- start:195 stop:677 length:483 start_codon:yes stop_codon:yes gene_type:complete
MAFKYNPRIWKLESVTASEKIVLLAVADSINKRGESAWGSFGYYSNKTGLSVSTVHRVVKALLSKGHLVNDGVHSKHQTRLLNLSDGLRRDPTRSRHGGSTTSGHGSKESGHGDRTPPVMVTYKQKEEEKEKQNVSGLPRESTESLIAYNRRIKAYNRQG